MPSTSNDKLYFIAFDHRGFFRRELVGADGALSDEQRETIQDAKRLILEGVRLAAASTPEGLGILVDDEFGAELVAPARELGILVAMPAERSDREIFEFNHGDRFGEEILAADPDITKVLVRYNAEGDRDGNAVQGERLRVLSDWLSAHERSFLLELIVEPTPAQLASVEGDVERFEEQLRPELIRVAIGELRQAGVEPGIWKVEGMRDRDAAEAIVEAARRDGREEVVCVVLGSGAPAERVDEWLRTVAGVEGFAGFAIGRSIWWPALRRHSAGEIDREASAEQIADAYGSFVEIFEQARNGSAVGA